jgi:hypothetical protein
VCLGFTDPLQIGGKEFRALMINVDVGGKARIGIQKIRAWRVVKKPRRRPMEEVAVSRPINARLHQSRYLPQSVF